MLYWKLKQASALQGILRIEQVKGFPCFAHSLLRKLCYPMCERIALLAGICCLLLVSGCARIGTRDVGSIEVRCSPVTFVVSLNDDDDNYSKVPVTMYLEGIGRSTRANDIGFEYHWNI